MTNRLILSAMITLALTFTPSLAFSVPTQSVKKKSTSKTHSKVSNKSKSSKKATSASSSRRRSCQREDNNEVVQSSVIPSSESRAASSTIGETRPLMKVTPQRDGGFLIEPLSPKKKTVTPLTRPSSAEARKDLSALQTEPKYAKFEPWDFSELVLAQAESYKHAPYSRGASLQTSSATDCSGFVQYIYHGFKIDLPRSSAEQAQVGKTVTREMDFSKLLWQRRPDFPFRRDASRPVRVRAKHFVRLARPDYGILPRTQAAKCRAPDWKRKTAARVRRRHCRRRSTDSKRNPTLESRKLATRRTRGTAPQE